MKKLALASAVAVASISAAQAAPTVYGKAFMTVDYFDTKFEDKFTAAKDAKATKLDSNASRVGFKGAEPLTANTDVIYQLEYGVDVDNNSSGSSTTPLTNNAQFYARNTFLGLSNKQYGTVLVGRHDTPFKLSKGDVDVFNAQNTTLGLDVAGGVLGEIRANNVIAYKSPQLYNMPVTFMAAVSLAETNADGYASLSNPYNSYNLNGGVNSSITSTAGVVTKVSPLSYASYTSKEKQSKDNGFSTSLVYDKNGLYGALGYDSKVDIEDKAWRVAGAVDLGRMNMVQGLTLGAMYQNVNVYDRKDASKSWLISGKYKVANTPWTVKAQYVNTDNGNNAGAVTGNAYAYLTDTARGNNLPLASKVTEIAIGGEYAFNKNTTGHIYAGQIDRDNIAKTTVIGTGLEYKF